MLLIVHQCFLMILSRKIIVRKATLQTTNKVFLSNIKYMCRERSRFSAQFVPGISLPRAKTRPPTVFAEEPTICVLCESVKYEIIGIFVITVSRDFRHLYKCCIDPLTILLNIMFQAPMGRFQLELMCYFTYFSTVVTSNICVFISCRPFVVNTTFSTGTFGVEVSTVARLGH